MKNQKEKIDLLFKEEIGGYEIAPPPELKEKVFIEMQASGFYNKKGRNILIISLLLVISLMAFITVLVFNNNTLAFGKSVKNYSSKPQIAEKENILTSENNNKEIAITTQDNKFIESKNKTQDHYNKNTQNKPYKIGTKSISNQNETIITTDPDIQKLNDISINDKPDIIINDSYVIKEKNNNTESSPPTIYNNTSLPERINNIDITNFSIYDGNINDKLVRKIKTKQPLLISMDLNAGHSLVQGPVLNIAKTNNEDANKYTSKMQWLSGSIGMNIKFEKKHFFGEAGIQISKFTEEISTDKILANPYGFHTLEISGQNTQVDSTGYYHYFYISDSNIRVIDSVWAWEIDTSFYNTYDDVYKIAYDTLLNPSWKNSYYFVDLPLTFGWQKNFGRLGFGIKTGPIINMLIAVKGSMPTKYNNTIILSDIKDEFKKYQFGLSWQAAATIGYFVSSNVAVECSPYYRFTLIGIKPINTGVELKNNSFGLQLGLRYYF
jgi:hypothetical protein